MSDLPEHLRDPMKVLERGRQIEESGGLRLEQRPSKELTPTLEQLHKYAYAINLWPRNKGVPVQMLDVLRKQVLAAWSLRAENEPPECAGCTEFVRMQHDIASILGVDADTDSVDLHQRIYGALSTRTTPLPEHARTLLARAEELFQDECDPLLETDSFVWLQDVREYLRATSTKSYRVSPDELVEQAQPDDPPAACVAPWVDPELAATSSAEEPEESNDWGIREAFKTIESYVTPGSALPGALRYLKLEVRKLEKMVMEESARASQPPAGARTDEDYAIEHGRYLATAAERFMDSINAYDEAKEAEEDADTEKERDRAEIKTQHATEARSDHWRGLRSAVYEFRKRADRARPPSTKSERCEHGVWKGDHCWACQPVRPDETSGNHQ